VLLTFQSIDDWEPTGLGGATSSRYKTHEQEYNKAYGTCEALRELLRASLSVGHCAIAIWPYFLAMPKSISISQFLCYICKSSCSPPSGDAYLSDGSQSTFQYRWWPRMVRSPRTEGLW